MILNQTIKDMLKSNGHTQYITEIKTLFKFYQDNYIQELTPASPTPKNLIGQHCIVFLQTNLLRTKMLAKGYVDSLNKQDPLSAALTVRAYFETTGALAFLLKMYNQFREGTISEEDIEKVSSSLYLGVKEKGELIDAPDPVSIMKLIDSADHFLKKEYEVKDERFRKSYDALSEICHPNSFGYMLGYRIDETFTIHFKTDNEPFDFNDYQLNYFSITSSLYIDIYKVLKTKIEENEDIPFAEFKN